MQLPSNACVNTGAHVENVHVKQAAVMRSHTPGLHLQHLADALVPPSHHSLFLSYFLPLRSLFLLSMLSFPSVSLRTAIIKAIKSSEDSPLLLCCNFMLPPGFTVY